MTHMAQVAKLQPREAQHTSLQGDVRALGWEHVSAGPASLHPSSRLCCGPLWSRKVFGSLERIPETQDKSLDKSLNWSEKFLSFFFSPKNVDTDTTAELHFYFSDQLNQLPCVQTLGMHEPDPREIPDEGEPVSQISPVENVMWILVLRKLCSQCGKARFLSGDSELNNSLCWKAVGWLISLVDLKLLPILFDGFS